ncbi:MAG: M48 family metalloprotease [Proteobacteria bacterium]|nr:M48 family metalloprotease [Pseudomonadota bacterium]
MFAAEWTAFLLIALWVASFLFVLWLDRINTAQVDAIMRTGMDAEKDPPVLSVRDIARAYRALRAVCARAQVPCPELRIARNMLIGAYAYQAHIMLTLGIIRRLEDDELEALVGHELTHLLNKDSHRLYPSRKLDGVAFPLALLLLYFGGIGALFALVGFYNDPVMFGLTKVAMFWAMVTLVTAPLACRLWARHRSRRIEYEADIGAARLSSGGAVARMLNNICAPKSPWLINAAFVKNIWKDVGGNPLFIILAALFSVIAISVGILERITEVLRYIPYRLHTTHPPHVQRSQAVG